MKVVRGPWVRLRDSLRDGSFSRKVLARALGPRWVPAPHVEIDEYLATHYPGRRWKSLSPGARKTWVQHAPLFSQHAVRTIAYAGAHLGATALALNEAFPGARFVLLEPAPDTFRQLAANTAGCPNMSCLNLAAGASEGSQDFYLDAYAPASSLLPYETVALEEFPFLGRQAKTTVQVKPLDAIMLECGLAGQVDMLIMDVQGYEDQVLLGAGQTLESCAVVISELSLQPLYAHSSTFDSVHQALTRRGFCLRFLLNPLEGVHRQILQVDGVFVREPPRK